MFIGLENLGVKWVFYFIFFYKKFIFYKIIFDMDEYKNECWKIVDVILIECLESLYFDVYLEGVFY